MDLRDLRAGLERWRGRGSRGPATYIGRSPPRREVRGVLRLGQELASFWGDYESFQLPKDESQQGWDAFFAKKRSDAEAAGKQANEEKVAGFYVDLDSSGKAVLSPADISAGTIADDLQAAAQVVEMLLIKDHSRMKLEAETPYDSTHQQQHRLLPISHPEDWAAATDEFRQGGYFMEVES